MTLPLSGETSPREQTGGFETGYTRHAQTSEVPPVPLITAPCVFAGKCGLPSVALVAHGIGELPGMPRPMCLDHVHLEAASLGFQPYATNLDQSVESLRVEWLVAR